MPTNLCPARACSGRTESSVRPTADAGQSSPEESIIVGNTVLYGANRGRMLFPRLSPAGAVFAVRQFRRQSPWFEGGRRFIAANTWTRRDRSWCSGATGRNYFRGRHVPAASPMCWTRTIPSDSRCKTWRWSIFEPRCPDEEEISGAHSIHPPSTTFESHGRVEVAGGT